MKSQPRMKISIFPYNRHFFQPGMNFDTRHTQIPNSKNSKVPYNSEIATETLTNQLKLYESVRKGLAEIYKDENDVKGPAPGRENPYKDLDDVNEIALRENQVKVKTKKEQIKRGHYRVQERVKNFSTQV